MSSSAADNQNAKPVVNEVELTIPILQDMELTATQTATSVAQYMNFDADRIDEVKMALIEAIINAFEHSKSRDGKVRIKFLIGDDNLTVIIQDHGRGLNSRKLKHQKFNKNCAQSISAAGDSCSLKI